MKFILLIIFSLFILSPDNYGQYCDAAGLAKRINVLKSGNDFVSVASIAKTTGGKDIFAITLGKGDISNKPGIAVIGGISGVSLFSSEMVMQMAEKMTAQNPSILDSVSFYFLPDVTPDASEQYFSALKYEREENARSYDDDRDGKTDEDGCDDLNKDGLITWMRIKDPARGEWMVHPDNPYVMVKADRTKNEKGEYLVFAEGMDNDKDEKINEDQPGGIIFNKNWSYNYKYFDQGTGENAISEEETRGLAKFLFDHWNIFAVLMIGPENNLSKYCDLKANLIDSKIPSAVSEQDKPYFESAVNLYSGMIKLNNPEVAHPSGGDLLSWVYHHYTRFTFSTPAWNVKADKNNRGSQDFDYLLWANENGLKDQVVDWQKVSHPDFPDKEVEIGGIKPFLSVNPPLEVIDSVSDRHLEFLLKLSAMHPSLSFNDLKITKRKEDVFMIETDIINVGDFPTMTTSAAQSRWVKKIRVDISTSEKQEIAGGRKVFLFTRIDPGENVKCSWLINGKGRINLKAGSPQTGYISKDVELR